MNIELYKSYNSIKDEIKCFSSAMDIFRIVNLFKPRNWEFKVTFDHETNYLSISSDPALNDDDIRLILSGRLPIIYDFYGLIVNINDKSYNINLTEESGTSKKVRLEFQHYGNALSEQIKIKGFPVLGIFYDGDKLAKWFHDNTWYGSIACEGKSNFVSVDIFSKETRITCIKKTHPHGLEYSKIFNLIVNGNIIGEFTVMCNIKNDLRTMRHSSCGIIDVAKYTKEFWKLFDINSKAFTLVEFNTNIVNWYTEIPKFDLENFQLICKHIASNKVLIKSSPDYNIFQNNILTYNKVRSANRISERQKAAERAKKIYIGDTIIMNLPTCENELVALYMKLESRNALPYESNVIEYTPKYGIDAIGEFRFDPVESIIKYAPIEFEFKLTNYFDHGHPIEQTKLIICWEMGEIKYLNLNTKRINKWRYVLKVDDIALPVVVIKNIPSINIK